MTVRPFNDETDRPALLGLVRELQATEKRIFDRTRPPEEIGDWYVEYILSRTSPDKGVILIAEHEGEIAGYAYVRKMHSSEDSVLDEPYEFAAIIDLCVTESLRGHGIGKALLDACEAYARQWDVSIMRIGVLEGNDPAKSLYEASGFSPLSLQLEKRLPR